MRFRKSYLLTAFAGLIIAHGISFKNESTRANEIANRAGCYKGTQPFYGVVRLGERTVPQFGCNNGGCPDMVYIPGSREGKSFEWCVEGEEALEFADCYRAPGENK